MFYGRLVHDQCPRFADYEREHFAKRFGEEVPEEAWIAFHPTRDDGAWFLVDFEWTLVTGFSPGTRAEVKEARKRPARTPPVPPPNVGVPLHVVVFEKP